jgi:hypothetical protein
LIRKDGKPIPFDEVESFLLYLQYEDSTEVLEKTLSVVSASEQTVNYYTVEGDLSQAGTLLLEVKITMLNGNVFRSKTMKVKVDDALSYPEVTS